MNPESSHPKTAELEEFMAGFMGTEEYFQASAATWFYITEGMKAVAEREAAFWFCDVVASHAAKILRQDDFSALTLEVSAEGRAVFTATDGNTPAKLYARQEIVKTAFTPGRWTFYLESAQDPDGRVYGVLMLPSEH
jgi:hypothetical protein